MYTCMCVCVYIYIHTHAYRHACMHVCECVGDATRQEAKGCCALSAALQSASFFYLFIIFIFSQVSPQEAKGGGVTAPLFRLQSALFSFFFSFFFPLQISRQEAKGGGVTAPLSAYKALFLLDCALDRLDASTGTPKKDSDKNSKKYKRGKYGKNEPYSADVYILR